MFCNQCATPLQSDYVVCPKCGQAVGALAQPSRLERHLRSLGILWIVVGALFLIPSLFLLGLGGLSSIALPFTDEIARTVGPIVIFLGGCTLLILAAGGVCVGWGLMQYRGWARSVAVVLGVLALFHFPIGTALGIYTLWVLLG